VVPVTRPGVVVVVDRLGRVVGVVPTPGAATVLDTLAGSTGFPASSTYTVLCTSMITIDSGGATLDCGSVTVGPDTDAASAVGAGGPGEAAITPTNASPPAVEIPVAARRVNAAGPRRARPPISRHPRDRRHPREGWSGARRHPRRHRRHAKSAGRPGRCSELRWLPEPSARSRDVRPRVMSQEMSERSEPRSDPRSPRRRRRVSSSMAPKASAGPDPLPLCQPAQRQRTASMPRAGTRGGPHRIPPPPQPFPRGARC